MSTEVKFRRGTTAEHATFTGAAGEVTLNTDLDAWVVHDGVTAGGFPIQSVNGFQLQRGRYGGLPSGSPTSGDFLELTMAIPVLTYTAGLKITWRQEAANTGAVDIDVDGLGSKNLKKIDGGKVEMESGDLQVDGIYEATYDGTEFVIVGISLLVPGTWVELGSVSGTAVATLDIEDIYSTTYDVYRFVFRRIRSTSAGVTMLARFKMGGSYITGTDYVESFFGAVSITSATSMRLTASSISPGSHVHGFVDVFDTQNTLAAGDADGYQMMKMHTVDLRTTGDGHAWSSFGAAVSATSRDNVLAGVRFYCSAGNITGRIDVYGQTNQGALI